MRVVVAAVGRLKDGPERSLVARYMERAGQVGRGIAIGPLDIHEISESRARRPEDRKREEADGLRALVDSRFHRIALDERGKSRPSGEFAARLGRLRDEGCAGVVFLIGGADGLDEALVGECDERLSFGAMTLPHQIVRVLAAEQVYRAATILAGHPYHRD